MEFSKLKMKHVTVSSDSIRKFFVTAASAVLLTAVIVVSAQETATPNGIADNRLAAFAFTNGNFYQPDGTYVRGGTLLISEGLVVELAVGNDVPAGYFEIDLEGKYGYPGFIDVYTDYGISELERRDDNGNAENLYPSDRAFNVNDAIRSNFRASTEFTPDTAERDKYRELGFSSVLSLRPDGIARGTSALITLGNKNANESIVAADAAAHYSLDKGTSSQSMPVSLMGSFALIRQTFLDAQWFGAQQPRPFTDDTLEAWNSTQALPQIMEVENWQEALTVDRVGDEFETQYILKTTGDSFRQSELIKGTNASLIIPIDFPSAPEVNDPLLADGVSFEDLKHWELAPFNPRILEENEIEFAITSSGGSDKFWENLNKAVDNGLSEHTAINAITSTAAGLLGLEDLVGQLSPNSLANFVITSSPLFAADSQILENWIEGERFVLTEDFDDRAGTYALSAGGQVYLIEMGFENGEPSAELVLDDNESRRADLDLSEELITLSFAVDEEGNRLRLSGWPIEDSNDFGWHGNGRSPSGDRINWRMIRNSGITSVESDTESETGIPALPSEVIFPFTAYGRTELPAQQNLLIRGATVWTNEDIGNVITDVLVRDGRIAAVGDNLSADQVTVIDGSGKHLTPGIIDEHSHIALFNINETQTNSSMVRMKDVVNSENINIYRNLAGGVVAAQLLHGSANPIGGQSAIVKMRWGASPQDLLIEGADEFIKFALGENVKRSSNPASIRYPQTRMGVEQVFVDAFSQAQEYGKAWDQYNSLSRTQQRDAIAPRRDLVDETMLEILNGERFVTSHSYVQSEINMLMHVADSFDFNINTFTHILEGYKVADKMARHGAGGSTFSDWWGYKWEVRYAIPYNAALMQQAGVVVALNSDDAELSRRLNQEAAKAVKYGGVSEIDALKMVTLNPAILLHLDSRMGSIREGKDADLVLWSDHPLSIYAVAETTWIEGIPYYDRDSDMALRQQIASERARIIGTMSNNSGND